MASVSVFIWWIDKLDMYNTSADMQGFSSPPPFDEKSNMAYKDGWKRTTRTRVGNGKIKSCFLDTLRIPKNVS